jgi:4-amino-4-deoxy-L-arabinose transferase-like glycosyltransferase
MQTLVRIWSRPAGALAILFLAALLYWGGEYLRRELWAPDEARFAYISQEMREDGHWLVPHRNGEYYAHKPPLMFWMINGAATLFAGGGINAFTARFPSLLGAVATLWSVVMLMRLWKRGRDDAAAALLCAATYLVTKEGGWGQIDMLLCGLEMLAVLALFSQDEKPSFSRAFGAYFCMGLAILAKGPVGFLVPMLAYLAAKLAAREYRDLCRWHWVWGPLVTLALPGIWLLLVVESHPPDGYLNELLFSQNIDRAQGEFGHLEPFYYFLTYFPLDGLPWVALLPFAWSALGHSSEDRALRRRLAGWMILVVVFFSLSPSKRNLYILLTYPALALMVASAWNSFRETRALVEVRKALLRFPLILLLLLLGLFLAAPWLIDWAVAAPTTEAKLGEDLAIVQTIPFLSAVPGLFAAVLLMLLVRRLTNTQPDAPWRLGFTWVILFATIGGVLLPLLNDHKTPKELVPLVAEYVPEGGRLHLYRLNGENLALYTGKRGKVLRSHEELTGMLTSTSEGLIVFEDRMWEELPENLALRFTPHPFRLGGKHLIAAHWGEDPGSASSR